MRRRKGGRGAVDFLVATIFILGVAGLAALLQTWNSREMAGAVRVIDGDSIMIDGADVRLRGIDAPELGQQCMGDDGARYPCGQLAANHLETLIDGNPVVCTGHDTDRYGRFLGVCRKAGGDHAASLNAMMVEDGWAVAYGGHDRLERLAQAERRGLWAWRFERPADWRRQRAAADAQAPPRAGFGAAIRRIRSWIGWGGHDE
ncbi:MAG: thermonuclease family protein [Roseitalea sp.]|jgi:endonuclease YncB( thermonuclease family)|nr:thermonuclease family protein [Roseitalea sp.]MBO6722651.1 thermonuclease family protein [Roseitalea sp.]MBO6741565.1 thermonuclease family protein [Roseitalea sp.]